MKSHSTPKTESATENLAAQADVAPSGFIQERGNASAVDEVSEVGPVADTELSGPLAEVADMMPEQDGAETEAPEFTDPVQKFASNLANTDPAARSVLEGALRKAPETYLAMDWTAAAASLTQDATVASMLTRPLNYSHPFGRSATPNQAAPAFEAAAGSVGLEVEDPLSWVNRRKSMVYANPDFEYARESLARQVFDQGQTGEATADLRRGYEAKLLLANDEKDPIKRFSPQLSKADPAARETLENALRVDPDAYGDMTWQDAKAIIAQDEEVVAMLNKPMLKGHAFGASVTENQAVPAFEAAAANLEVTDVDAADWVSRRKSLVHDAGTPEFADARANLAEQVFDVSHAPASTDGLQHGYEVRLSGTGHEGHHNEYKPIDMEVEKLEDGSEIRRYSTKVGSDFEALVGPDMMTRSIKGTNLHLKSQVGIGGRGYTANAEGKVSGAEQHAAHLIADIFTGSGYRQAANLIATSDNYNLNEMSKAEDAIAEAVTHFGATSFDMEVNVEWGDLQEEAIIDDLVDEAVDARLEEQPDLSDEELAVFEEAHRQELLGQLAAYEKQFEYEFSRCLGTEYKITLHLEDGSTKQLDPIVLGPDKYVGFDD